MSSRYSNTTLYPGCPGTAAPVTKSQRLSELILRGCKSATSSPVTTVSETQVTTTCEDSQRTSVDGTTVRRSARRSSVAFKVLFDG
jgi:hypothetical protein